MFLCIICKKGKPSRIASVVIDCADPFEAVKQCHKDAASHLDDAEDVLGIPIESTMGFAIVKAEEKGWDALPFRILYACKMYDEIRIFEKKEE